MDSIFQICPITPMEKWSKNVLLLINLFYTISLSLVHRITHCSAILQHLGRKYQLYPESEGEMIAADMIREEIVDLRGAECAYLYFPKHRIAVSDINILNDQTDVLEYLCRVQSRPLQRSKKPERRTGPMSCDTWTSWTRFWPSIPDRGSLAKGWLTSTFFSTNTPTMSGSWRVICSKITPTWWLSWPSSKPYPTWVTFSRFSTVCPSFLSVPSSAKRLVISLRSNVSPSIFNSSLFIMTHVSFWLWIQELIFDPGSDFESIFSPETINDSWTSGWILDPGTRSSEHDTL